MKLVLELRSDLSELQAYAETLCADGDVRATLVVGDDVLTMNVSMPTDDPDVRKFNTYRISWLELGAVRNRLSLLRCELDRIVQELRHGAQLAVHA